jgi:hypothetical protein
MLRTLSTGFLSLLSSALTHFLTLQVVGFCLKKTLLGRTWARTKRPFWPFATSISIRIFGLVLNFTSFAISSQTKSQSLAWFLEAGY